MKRIENQVRDDLEKQYNELLQEWGDTLTEEEKQVYTDVANWLDGRSHKTPTLKKIREAYRVRKTAPYELVEASRRLWALNGNPTEEEDV